jgi:tetratricopeptide (TPR) repeat protein
VHVNPVCRLSGLVLCLLAAAPAAAIDTVTRKSTDKAAIGEIDSVSRTEVVVKPRVGSPTTVPANDIVDVDWDAAPPSLKLGRSQESSGQFDLALKSYQQAVTDNQSSNANVRGEIEFSLARVTARVALGDPARLADATTKLTEFAERFRDHYRYFDAQLLLGDLALAGNNAPAAEAVFDVLLTAPWADYQMAGNIGKGRILFARDDISGAKQAFDAVAVQTPRTAAETSRKLEAMLGQAKCLQKQGQHADAVQILDQVVQETSVDNTRLQAEAYVRQGESYAAMGDKTKEAIRSYLFVDVVSALAQQTDFHAEALYHLAQLWPAAGHQERGVEASARLEQLYPNSAWARKLTGTQ